MHVRITGFLILVGACHVSAGGPTEETSDGLDSDATTADTDPLVLGDTDTTGQDDSDDSDAAGAACGGCDDQDPCTTDRCVDGVCHYDAWDGDPMSLWDLAAYKDASTLDIDVLSTTTVVDNFKSIRVQEIRFTSYESEACEIRPVRLEAYVAMPMSAVGRAHASAGLVVAHGLGQFATADAAIGPASDMGVVTIAYSGPGQGQSQGTSSTSDHLFDTTHIPRDSWFWEHAVGAMRAITVLDTYSETDASRIGVTGYSGGAVATLMVNGVDDRVKAAVPVSGMGHLDQTVLSGVHGWEVDLLAGMAPPRDASSPEWAGYEAGLDPSHYLASAHGAVMLLDGAQDEFFPLTTTAPTFADLQATGGTHRLLIIQDWDHGWFALFNSDQPIAWIDANTQHWFRHFLALGGAPDVPPQPTLGLMVDGICSAQLAPCLLVQANLPATPMDVVEAHVHFSLDGLTFLDAALEDKGALGWVAEIPFLSAADWGTSKAVWYAEFALRRGLFGDVIHVASAPSLPPGFKPSVLAIQGPIP